jgi:uncharacterized protein YcbX
VPTQFLVQTRVGSDGLEGDRRFAIYDVATGFGLTARRVPELLFASARLLDDNGVEITLPDGTLANDDDALSHWLRRRVELRSASAEVARRYENVIDFEQESASEWTPFEGAAGPFHDSAGARYRWCRRQRSDLGIAADFDPMCCSRVRVRMR